MAQRDKSRFRRKCRIAFRRFRIAIWLLILALLGAVLYLNQVGLPEFVKRPLQDKLRAQGLDLEFSRMRWRWGQGIVAENVQFGRIGDGPGPQLSVKEARLLLDYRELARLRVQVRALVLRQGELSWHFATTNDAPDRLSVTGIQTELRLVPDDLWELNNFRADFAGAQIQLGGVITNASAIRHWKFMRSQRPDTAVTLEGQLRRLADTLDQIHFTVPPELHLDVRGDALDLQSFTVRLNVNTPGADTPWGTVHNAFLALVLLPGSSNVVSEIEAKLEASRAETRWAKTENLTLQLRLLSTHTLTNKVDAHLALSAANIQTGHGQAARAQFNARWTHALTNAIPLHGRGELQIERPETQWGRAAQLRLVAHLRESIEPAPVPEESWAWWSLLAPHALDWECALRDLRSPRVEAGAVSCSGSWRAPQLDITGLSATLYGGALDATAALDVATRHFQFAASSDFEPHKVAPLLTQKSRQWLSQYSWEKPPAVAAQGTLVLPAWTNQQPDWRGEVRPTIRLNGQFEVGTGAFRGVTFSSATSHFTYSNLFWHLPDLVALRPEGRVELMHRSHEATHDYYFQFRSTIDTSAVRPLLEPEQLRGFDMVGFTEPPAVQAEVWGRWYEPDLIGFRGRVAATNFTVRGQTFSSLQTELAYTNRFLTLTEPRALRGTEQLSAGKVGLDFTARKIYLTNGFATADPLAVSRAIGPKIGAHMEPYRFVQPPTVRAEGVIPMQDERDADLHFQVDGGPFEWWKFRVPRITGRVDWVGEQLALQGVRADFYQGVATGNAAFDFNPARPGADFRFSLVATDADLHLLMNDLAEQPNRLEGGLTVQLEITGANSSTLDSVQGHGRVSLNDGLIWDIPIFGILSPALDSIVPGLGSSRAREGSASFRIINGWMHSDDLEIRASGMRLQYSGDLDLHGNVEARVQAELLRDMWGVGRLVSLALWPVSKIFEYKITGTVYEPKSSPVFFIPKIVLLPFHPIRTVKELFPELPPPDGTNAPAAMP